MILPPRLGSKIVDVTIAFPERRDYLVVRQYGGAVEMRRMVFADASEVRERMQTVTRRPGWRFLKPGDLVLAVEPRPRGPAAVTGRAAARELAVLRIRDVRVESLSRLTKDATYAEDELPREGLPCWSRDHFIATFLRRHRLKSVDVEITRIEFGYVEHVEKA